VTLYVRVRTGIVLVRTEYVLHARALASSVEHHVELSQTESSSLFSTRRGLRKCATYACYMFTVKLDVVKNRAIN
jgi:hypothetical protein